MRFNINDKVWVKLNDRGREIWKHSFDAVNQILTNAGAELLDQPSVIEDSDGWSEWQLWHLMEVFGPHMHHGCRVPFETEMKVLMVDKQEYEITQQEKELALSNRPIEALIEKHARIAVLEVQNHGDHYVPTPDERSSLTNMRHILRTLAEATGAVTIPAQIGALTARAEQAGREPDCDTRVRDAIYLEAYAASELGGQTAHCARFEQIAQHLRGIRPDPQLATLTQAKEAAEAALVQAHAECHDLVCNGSRDVPRGAKGHCCSCLGRDAAYAEQTALKAEVARLTAYVQHKAGCRKWAGNLMMGSRLYNGYDCDCGLDTPTKEPQ